MLSKSFWQELKLLKVFYIWGFLIGLAAFLGPYYILYFLDIGLSYSQMGLIFSAAALGSILFEVPTGAIADRFGRKFSVILGWLLAALTILLIPLTNSFWLILTLYFIFAAVSTLASGSDSAWLADYLRSKKREDLIHTAMARQSSFMYAGGIIAFALSGLIVARLSMTWLWYIQGLVMLFTVMFLMWFGEEKFSRKKSRGINSDLRETYRLSKNASSYALRNKVLLILIIASSFAAIASTMSNMFWQPYMTELGIPIYTIGPLFALLSVFGMIVSNLSMKYLKIFGNHRIAFIATSGISIFLLSAIALVNSAWIFMLLWLIFGSITIASSPISASYFQKNAPPKMRATLGSLKSMIAEIGRLIAPVLGGVIAEAYGLRAAIIVSAIFIVPTIFLYWKLDESKIKSKLS